jgi:hypothetical protein
MYLVGWIILKWLKYDMKEWIELGWVRRRSRSDLVGK